MKHVFYERQEPYQASLKASFMHLKALMLFNQDKMNFDGPIKIIDEALAIVPNFNLASITKQVLESRKNASTQRKK